MSKNNDNKLVPKLRFPEFVNEGDWKTGSLGELVDIKGRIGYRGYTTADIVEKGKGAITLSPSNFDENGRLNFDKCTYISWSKYDESPEIMLENGQTVLVKTASVGKSAYVENLPEKTTINPQIVILKPLSIEPKFLAYTVFHSYVQIQIKSSVGAGAIPNMSQDSISKFKILLPPDNKQKEQQKIAACLSSIDEIITAESQKLELLKEHKKGLLQNLFPQEGETVPKLRFKEFDSSDEWVEKKIGDLFTFKQGVQVPVENQFHSKNDGMVRFLRIIDITNSAEPERYIENPGNNHLICKNDLFMIRYGTPGLISIGYDGVIANNLFRLIWNNNEFYKSKFWYFVFQRIEKFIYDLSTSSSMPAISFSTLEGISLLYPKNTSEQQKIAETLSSLDDLITAQSQKIEALKMHKKGLLQGLFPDVNEVDLSNLRSLKTDQN